MARGYFLHIGDKTTCGGEIRTGSATLHFHGIGAARAGDIVTCGIFPGVFKILGGLPNRRNGGQPLAGTLHSVSSCLCRATFIPSIEDGYEIQAVILPDTVGVSVDNSIEDDEPEQYAQSAKRHKKPQTPEQEPQSAREEKATEQSPPPDKKKREITLTIGVFFDGTGNNSINVENMLKACSGEQFNLNSADAQSILTQSAQRNMGVSGIGSGSYIGYHTNIHWLNTLYKQSFSTESGHAQRALYIEGIGTEAGKPDSKIGKGLGTSDTGVIAKTDKAVTFLEKVIQRALLEVNQKLGSMFFSVKSLQFDIFGFSRGAAAARHFANRIQSEDTVVIEAIRQGMGEMEYLGAPSGKIRFIGIFDTVAAIGTPANGLNPHSADTGDVNIVLRPGIAEKVFHITAQNESRFNFALNSVQPAWPELALPGAHSDIGGGYLPLEQENLYLTRPDAETVLLTQPGQETRVYRQAMAQRQLLETVADIAPIVRTNKVIGETWFDDRMPQDRYGNFQKRSFAALVMRERIVKNDWSKVVLRVMLDAAQEAGVLFDPIRETNKELQLPPELIPYCNLAISLGKRTRTGKTMSGFTTDEIDLIAKDYIHCSAKWNAVEMDEHGKISGGTSVAEIIFTDRPDEEWRRTVYNMDGKKV